MDKNNIIECLNDLLTKAYDAEQGFKQAAERAEGHPRLVTFFNQQSALRLSFGHDIKQAISRHGGEPDKGSSAAAKAHQVWIALKDALTPEDDGEAILEECIRGERAALEEYDEKLKCSDLPADVHALIVDQRTKIAESLSQVCAEERLADN